MPSTAAPAPAAAAAWKTRGVVVLGVHRSGTSLLTAGLEAIGCDLGDKTLNTSSENPKGFFENHPVHRFNDALLTRLGASWDNWGFRAGLHDFTGGTFAGDRAAAGTLLETQFAGSRAWAVKDPRMSLIYPFWVATFREHGIAPKRILIVRDPAEVAESQVRRARRSRSFHRNIMAAEPMHALWCVTMLECLRALDGDDTLLVRHRSLYRHPAETLAAIADYLGLSPERGAIETFSRDILDRDLYRARRPAQGGSGAWARLADRFYRTFGSATPPHRLDRSSAHAIAERQTELTALLPYLGAVRETVGSATAAAVGDGRQLEDLRRALEIMGDAVVDASDGTAAQRRVSDLVSLAGTGPDRADILRAAARLAEHLGLVAEAEPLFAAVIERGGASADDWAGRIRCLTGLGRMAEAHRAADRARALFPDDRWLEQHGTGTGTS